MNRHARRPTRARAGFSMMEVLVAIGIFALGFVAVAAIFPSAAMMQRGTAEDVHGRHAERTARAIIDATRFTYQEDPRDGNLAFYHADDDDESCVRPFEDLDDFWSLDARSYPASTPDRFLRDFYWVPLVRNAGDHEDPDWHLHVFILSRRDGNYVREDYDQADPSWKDEWANPDDGHGDPGDYEDNGEQLLHEHTWFVPGVRRKEVDVLEVDPDDYRRFEFDNYHPDVEGLLIRRNDRILHECNGRRYRVEEADVEGVVVESRIQGDPADDHAIWYGYRGRDTTGIGCDPVDDPDCGEVDDLRHSPTKRIFTIPVEHEDPQ